VATCSGPNTYTSCSGSYLLPLCSIASFPGAKTASTANVATDCADGFYKTTDTTYNCRACGLWSKTCTDN